MVAESTSDEQQSSPDADTSNAFPELAEKLSALVDDIHVGLKKPSTPKKVDAWESARVIANWIAAILIPLVLGISGYFVTLTIESQSQRANQAIKDKEFQSKMIELVANVLTSSPDPEGRDREIREWARDVINDPSKVPKLPERVVVEAIPHSPIRIPLPATLGIDQWLVPRAKYFRIPEYDQQPEETARELAQVYTQMADELKKSANDDDPASNLEEEQEFVNKMAADHKSRLSPILDRRPGRREDWEVLIKDLTAEIQLRVNNDEFAAGDPRFWALLYDELAIGFQSLAVEFERDGIRQQRNE